MLSASPSFRANCGDLAVHAQRHALLDVLEVARRRRLSPRCPASSAPRSSAARAACASTSAWKRTRHSLASTPRHVGAPVDLRAAVGRRASRRPSASVTLSVAGGSGRCTSFGVAPRSPGARARRGPSRAARSSPCTRRCRRGTGRARARTRSRDRTAPGSPARSRSRRWFAVRTMTSVAGMPSLLEHRHDERRLVFAVAEAAREDLRAPVRLEAVDAELERHVARLLRRRSRRSRAPSRASVLQALRSAPRRGGAPRRPATNWSLTRPQYQRPISSHDL